MFSKKTLLPIFIVLSVAMLIAFMVMQKPDVTKIENKKEAKYVTTAVAQKGNWQPMHSVIGKISSNNVGDIYSEVNAKVLNVFVKSGDFVKTGQSLVELDAVDADRELQRLNAQLSDLTAQIDIQKGQHELDRSFLVYDQEQLKQAQENYSREKKLLARQLISNSRFEQVEAELNQAKRTTLQRELGIKNQTAQQQQLQASLKQLQISIDIAKEQVDAHIIKASFNGQVGNLSLRARQSVSVGQTLLTLLDDQSRLFEVKVSSELAKQSSATLVINDERFPILSVNPLLEAQQAGQQVVFDISGQTLPLGSYQYAYWVSPVVEESFLIEPKALFEFERVYYLKEVDSDFELEEAKVQLHGINIVDGKEFWIATSEKLPDSALLLTSKLNNLYSGIKVTNKLPEIEDESEKGSSDSMDANKEGDSKAEQDKMEN